MTTKTKKRKPREWWAVVNSDGTWHITSLKKHARHHIDEYFPNYCGLEIVKVREVLPKRRKK